MTGLELVLLLLAVSAALQVLALRLGVPHPVLLVVVGLLLALIPGLPRVELAPDVLFLIFVPPLLYWGARRLSFRDFRQALGPIIRLAVVMVFVSTAAVAVVAHALDPAFTWAAAFVLGAIVAPPDAVAALTVIRSVGGPSRIANILEGEGLLNDATALVTYRMAIAAAVTGSFSLPSAVLQFVLTGAGGVAIGLAVGLVIRMTVPLVGRAPVVQNTISLLVPFAAYLPAQLVGASGVLAVVTTGIYMGRQIPRFVAPETRVQNEAMWSVVTFLLESLVFILVGFELPAVTRALTSYSLGRLLGEAALVTACVIAVRLVWVWPSSYVPNALDRWLWRRGRPWRSWREVFFIGWTGMRGGDSLVIALALPFTTRAGAPFPAREQIVFITFVVIFSTLVLHGASLRPLLRWLGLRDDGRAEDEEAHARLVAAEEGLRVLDEEAVRNGPYAEVVRYLRQRHRQRARRWAAREERRFGGRPHDGEDRHVVAAPSHEDGALDERRGEAYRRLRARMIEREQRAVVALRDQGVIGDEVMRRVQHDLDLEAMLLDAREPVVEPPSEVNAAIGQDAKT